MLNQLKPSESFYFKIKIIPDEDEQMKKKEFETLDLGDFWDPIIEEKEKEKEHALDLLVDRLRVRERNFWSFSNWHTDAVTHSRNTEEYLALRDYRGEQIIPIYPKYNCKIPIKCFKRPKFKEAWMSYRANSIKYEHTIMKNPLDPDQGILPFSLEYCCHRTNKSVLVRSGLEFEVEGLAGSYSLANTLSYQDLVDFLSANFIHLKNLISSENEDCCEEKVHKLACMFTSVRYVALIQGYFGNSKPSHWEIVEEEIKEKISKDVMQEIFSMKSDVLKLIIATAAQWWTADFSIGTKGKFPPLLKKTVLELETLKPIFQDLMGCEEDVQFLIHKATHFVDKRNVLKAINMDNHEWTGEIPMGLPIIKKVNIEKLGNPQILEVLKRVPAGYSSYSNCHQVLEIMKKYKLSEFIFEKHQAELVYSVMKEIAQKPNYHHINSSYLNENDSRFQKPKRHYKSKIRDIVLECGIFLLFTGCHKGLQKSTIFYCFMPRDFTGILRICPYWLFFLLHFIHDKVRIEKAKQFLADAGYEEGSQNRPFSQSPASVLMEDFASTFRIRNGHFYWTDENGISLLVGPVDKSKENNIEHKFCEGFNKLFSDERKCWTI